MMSFDSILKSFNKQTLLSWAKQICQANHSITLPRLCCRYRVALICWYVSNWTIVRQPIFVIAVTSVHNTSQPKLRVHRQVLPIDRNTHAISWLRCWIKWEALLATLSTLDDSIAIMLDVRHLGEAIAILAFRRSPAKNLQWSSVSSFVSSYTMEDSTLEMGEWNSYRDKLDEAQFDDYFTLFPDRTTQIWLNNVMDL
jgi:hypothetical protein